MERLPAGPLQGPGRAFAAMTKFRKLLCLLGLLLWPLPLTGQEVEWRSTMDQAVQAHIKGNQAGAERLLLHAITLGEQLEPQDERLVQSLVGLSSIYFEQGRFF